MYPEEVIRFVSGKYDAEDKKFVENWIAEDPAARQKLEHLQRIWEATGNLELDGDEDAAWEQLSARIKQDKKSQDISKIGRFPVKNTNSNLMRYVLRAAAVLMIVAGTYGFYQTTYTETLQENPQKDQLVYHTLVSDAGEQVQFRFNDGSKVVLNSNSQIRYRSDFGKGTRTLELTGEAYFEVDHDHPLPFVVEAGNMRVKDIGTKFNINAYREGKFFEVAVSKGEVEVSTSEEDSGGSQVSQSTSQPVRISQGQAVEVDRKAGQMVISKANLHASLGWLNQRLIFQNEPFSDIVNRLERYYDITIDVRDKVLLDKKVTASFRDERMENVFKVLSLSLKANYNLNKNHVELYKKENGQLTK